LNLQPGQELLHYRIVEKIGEGGMGEVWKALDTTLDREVALKLIPDQFAGDPERLARFVREARLLATLNHPNIAAVYGLHEAGGSHFIAMELVPGEDLAQRLVQGSLSVEDALDVARQVADALEAAHEQGVIHRDLKPANIKRAPDGKIKVLDLGLAKALTPEMSSDAVRASRSPTVTSAGTVAGVLLGTVAYMSPEQARGRPADRRADIWAFGVVLHEMLTGTKLFDAETVSETLAALLRDELSMDALPSDLPAPVANLLRRCLDRDPRTRLRDIGEARVALSPEALAAPPVAAELSIPVDQLGVMALSPDGTSLALALVADGQRQLFVRRLDGTELQPMEGTQDASSPFFSADGQWIGFFADNKLKKVPVTGGAPVTICDSDGANRGASWGTDDVIVFSPHYVQPLMQVSGAGGEPQALTSIEQAKGERTHRWPQSVPGEDLVLFTVGTIDSLEVRGSPAPVLEGVMGMSASGVVHADFASNGLLAYIAGDPQVRQTRLVWRDRGGSERPLAAQVAGGTDFDIWTYNIEQEKFTRLTFEGDNGGPVWSPDSRRIAFYSVRNNALMGTWVKAADGGGQAGEVCAPSRFGSAGQTMPGGWAPDGESLIVMFSNENGGNIATCAEQSDEVTILLDSPAGELHPALSPNGRWLAYASDESGNMQVFVRDFPRPGGKWQVSTDGGNLPRWSPDGTELFYRRQSNLHSVVVDESGDSFNAGRPTLVFDDLPAATATYYYDVFDAGRFLLVQSIEDDKPPVGVTMMVHWLDELHRRVPN
jgi:serine/threonine-protein kinase